MGKIWDNWSGKRTNEKVLSIIGIICSIAVIVLATMSLCDIWEDADFVYMPLMGVIMLIQAIQNRNKDRSVVIISLLAVVIIFACTISKAVLKF